MPGTLREHSWPVLFSVLLHAALAAGMLLMAMMSARVSTVSVEPPAVNAVVVDSRILHAAQDAKRARIEAEQQAAAARAAAAEEAKAAAESKVAEEAKAAEAVKAAAQAKVAEEANAAQARAAEAKQAADARQAAEAKRAADAKRTADAKQAEDAKRAAETKARDERLRRDSEAELRRQMAEEEHVSAVEAGPKRDLYAASLRNRIQHEWRKPPSARVGIDCLVEVTQAPGGVVISARVTQCNGDAAVLQSIENAVIRASPLPEPPDPALFQRNFAFRFKPDE